ncbi:MAG: DUF885 family protein [Alphaproteobacteria bacterium]|nr:DUF885 family protein [Alphaproteobacteria bacterium]MBU1516123.1 DUF885 family protein [Alphaproteobacteria bacterium]MBU2092662.1 DUF885 family protein [Alphaproteobacteria bacterium]MBU2308441.1 DUF885 family protein [Alphaproteobacteria bacterium]MBU2363996.1 DUF885 family protein [Alphaproteobacteria bacterium]
MTTRRNVLITGAALGLSASPLAALAAEGEGVTDTRLAKLLDAFVVEILADNPQTASSIGKDKGPRAALKRRLDDISTGGRAKQIAGYADRAKRLRAIPRAGLAGRDLTTYDTVLYAQDVGAEGGRFAYGKDYANPYVVSQQDGTVVNTGEFLNAQHLIETEDDAEAYLARLEQYGPALDQETDRVKDAAGKGVILPDFLLATALKQGQDLRAMDAGATRLVGSLVERTKAKGIDGDWQARASAIVSQTVFPALERQVALLKSQQTRATHDAGVWKFSDGADYYRWGLKYNTTTNRTPAEIHKTGLEQGAEMDALMDGILKGQGYTQGTVGERMGALTKDPKYLFPNTEAGRREVLAYIEGSIAAIRPFIPKFSKLGLKAPVEVRAVPKEIESGAGLGYMNFAALDGSRPAIYYVNLKDTGNWPKYTLASLSMHEALPGHAWQGAYLAERSSEIHTISSLMNFGAFIEGWGLYAEQLADEVGLYAQDPMGRLGYLQALRFRCARLVVDTGLHDKRWTREHAIEWMVAATGRSTGAITSEVDRYCASPGQACAYKTGHNEIVRLRAKAKAALGDRFDLRDFDDAVVTTGGTPLAVLEGVIDRYITGTRKA